jgi:hypothetical protein
MWQILCSEYPFYHGNYWQTNWPSMLSHRITSKDSTDTFIEQAVHRFFWKGSQKANYLSVYANEQSDRLLARPLSDKSLPHVTFNPPVQWQSQPIPFVVNYNWQIYVGIVKLSIVRGRTSINLPSNSHVLKTPGTQKNLGRTQDIHWNELKTCCVIFLHWLIHRENPWGVIFIPSRRFEEI